MAVFIFASVWWVLSARKWFRGPVRTVEGTATPDSYDKTSVRVDEKQVSAQDR